MSSRRILASEKTLLEKDDRNALTPSAAEKSNITPAVPASVIIKLLGFTFAMICGPIGIYFLTLNTVFQGKPQLTPPSPPRKKGNSTLSGATAAVTANVVLIAYILVAVREDQSESLAAAAEKEKKSE
ncbi:MAG: vacuolar ATPase assembly integral membrane protein vma21 [Sarea resinae]|nr:MAG: vacuolar ATPase assembly integral membrane protein vma21 [Sarea resinae]